MPVVTLDINSNNAPVIASGTYTGTTASQTIAVGFAPSWIQAWNQTDGDTVWYWHKSSLTNYVAMTTAAATVSAAITTVDSGFVLAASDAVANENGKTYVYLCGR